MPHCQIIHIKPRKTKMMNFKKFSWIFANSRSTNSTSLNLTGGHESKSITLNYLFLPGILRLNQKYVMQYFGGFYFSVLTFVYASTCSCNPGLTGSFICARKWRIVIQVNHATPSSLFIHKSRQRCAALSLCCDWLWSSLSHTYRAER